MLGKSLINPRMIGLTSELDEVVKRENIDRIIVAMGERRGQLPTDEFLQLSLTGKVNIEEGASFYERVTGRVSLNMIRPSWLIFSSRGRQTRISGIARNIVHRIVALIGGSGLVANRDCHGCVDQTRIFGRRFLQTGTSGKERRPIYGDEVSLDARQTQRRRVRFGPARTTIAPRASASSFARLRIDEIPQFWNILRGEMDFVGPRPERPHFVSQLAEEIPYYEQRHLIAPGLTGWAQIKYPYGASIEDARQKLQYDLYYIKNQSLMLDATILFETIKIILFGRGR